MSTDVERLAVLIEANTKSYERAMVKLQSDTDKALKGVERRFKDSATRLEGLFSMPFKALAGFAGFAGAARGVQEVVSAFKDLAKIGDIAERIGTTTDFLQALRFTVQQNGGDLTDADAAMQKFADSLGEAAVGTTYLTKLFNANGVALKDQAGNLRSVDAMLGDFARLVANATSPQEKMMLVTEAFGRKAGPAMLVALTEIAQKGLPGMTAAAKEAGAVVDKELIARAKVFDDEWDKATLRASNGFKSFLVKSIDKMIEFDKKVTDSKENLAKLGQFSTMDGTPGIEPPPADANVPGFKHRLGNALDPANYLPTKPPAGPKTNVPKKGGDDGFQNAIEQARKRIEVINAETATIGMNSEARARAKLIVELETAAKEANKAAGLGNAVITQQQSAAIGVLAEKMLEAERKSREMETAFRSVNETTQFLGSTAQTAFENILDGADAATTAMKALRSELLKAVFTGQGAFANMFGMANSAGGTGGIFGMLGGIFGGGRATGGQVLPGKAYMVNEQTPRSEIFVPSVAGRIEQNKGGGYGSGPQGGSLTVRVSLDNDMLRALVTDESGRVVVRAAPSIIGAATKNAVAAVPAARRNNPGYFG